MFLQERILIDLASRGGSVVDHDPAWWNGPSWLSNPKMWPTNPVTEPRPESAAESKQIREVIANVTVSERDEFDDLLERGSLKKLRVCARMKRFLDKCRGTPVASGPLRSVELESQMECT
ncbi:Hypothetical predicted protein [Paramuricea clavata]|uniref:Uncharacterized protein n=1 Tax=Paramuricea clavata TaxID=317549 RepID=A0A6S7G068_PARCT|nr:Hypothetical predicted protein [Paramuricea clavata]